MRDFRLKNLKALGLVEQDVVAHPLVSMADGKTWEEKSEEEKRVSSRAMEIYAASMYPSFHTLSLHKPIVMLSMFKVVEAMDE